MFSFRPREALQIAVARTRHSFCTSAVMLRPLRSFLIVTAVLGSSASACASAVAPSAETAPFDGDVSIPAASALSCTASGRPDLADLKTEIGSDYVELRQGWPSASPSEVVAQNSIGVACSGAAQPAACQKAVSSIVPTPGFPLIAEPLLFNVVVLTTTGDRVQVARNANELANVFGGRFDTKAKVAVLLGLNNLDVACDDPKVGAIWADGDGFLAIAVQRSCNESNRVLVRIAKDGTLTVERRETIWRRTEGAVC